MRRKRTLAPTMIGELLEVIHNALLVIDSGCRMIFTNSRTAKMFAAAPNALMGQLFSTLFMPEDREILVPNILELTKRNREIETEAMFLRNDGETFLGHLSGTCFEWGENQQGMAFSIHDISDMKEIEQSLKHSERIVFLGRLVVDISHQIRNPVTVIGGFARHLQSEDGQSSKVRAILQEANRLEELLNSLTRFTRLPPPKTEMITFQDLVVELELQIAPRVRDFGCTWHCRCNETILNEEILLDRKLFLAAVLDVVKNSCEAYAEKLARENKSVQCEIYPSGDEAHPYILRIVDKGKGIDISGHERVFSHFYTDKTGHIGMGLTFARRIIEEQGGEVIIQSKAGHGTTVSFYLVKERRRSLRTTRIAPDADDAARTAEQPGSEWKVEE